MVSRSCDHDRDAGVYCFGKTIQYTTICMWWTYPQLCIGRNLDNCIEGNVRLAGGDGSSGRVQVCLDGQWGTVCDDGWDSNDATTVCRQLGYTDISKIMTQINIGIILYQWCTLLTIERAIPTRGAYSGVGSGPIHLSRAECRNNDTRLIDCSYHR